MGRRATRCRGGVRHAARSAARHAHAHHGPLDRCQLQLLRPAALRLPTLRHLCTPGSKRNSSSHSPSVERAKARGKEKSYSSKEKRQRKQSSSKHRKELSLTPPRSHKKTERSPISPKSNKRSERSLTPPRKYKSKDKRSETPLRKPRDRSVTPPKCYARGRSSSSSNSRSGSLTPKLSKRKYSPSSKSNHSRSRSDSSHSSGSSRRSRSKSKNRKRSKISTKRKSRSKSRTKQRSKSRSRSKSRKRSSSRGKGRRLQSSKSRSRSRSSASRIRSGSPSDDERRGQFTVEDRKRFWKMHRTRQEERERAKSPVKEVKPPPGAIESTTVDDIEYGDPPEVEGPNFAELLHPPDQVIQHSASTSKSKPMPIPIKNDGSFLEMFKKMQEETKKSELSEQKLIKKPALPFIGKRRGGRVLKTGLVKKAKAIDEQTVDNTPKDAWSLYMQEVKKYRETSCEEERKTRPLVK
ncbi:serine/arginine-rich splicing factor 4 isoform X2 [Battus philenor]|uniref:serine/arginine-rich splicing factor 4 isoform X2 n=1 Tax=Battus philenor TaxID=42288 RepID=UPI0035CEF43A